MEPEALPLSRGPARVPRKTDAINEVWSDADRQLCAVHRLRNIVTKLPNRPELYERIKGAYCPALDEAVDPDEAEQRLRHLVTTLEREYLSAARLLLRNVRPHCWLSR